MNKFIQDSNGHLINPDAVAAVWVLKPDSWESNKGKWFAKMLLRGNGSFLGPTTLRITKAEYDLLASSER